MMYFGGKAKVAKELSSFINENIRGRVFVDLFCGSCNVVSNVVTSERFANDVNPYIIATMSEAALGREFPEHISEHTYRSVKSNKDVDKGLSGFVGFGCSFSGKFFGGYARGETGRNYAKNAKASLSKKAKCLGDVVFSCLNYDEVQIPDGAVVYCDIPYKGTTGYAVGTFNHDAFYNYARELATRCTVLISEYEQNVPAFGKVIWRRPSHKSIRDAKGQQAPTVEVVFKL